MSAEMKASSAYAKLLLQSGTVAQDALLAGVGLDADTIAQQEFITATQLVRLFHNYNALADDRTWTIGLAEQFNVGTHGPLGFAALSAPTLGACLDVTAQFMPCRVAVTDATTSVAGDYYVLQIQDRSKEPDFAMWISEVTLRIIEQLLATVLGHPLGHNVYISFRHAPPDEADALREAYDSRVEFGADYNGIAIPLAWRQLPSPLYNETLYRTNLIQCREILDARRSADSALQRVRNRLSAHFDAQLLEETVASAPPTLQQMAASLHTSPRSLIRHLGREGSSYKEIVEELRKTYARQLLGDARLTVADVAEKLGYREPANFVRAFRRWFEITPAAWRRR